VSTVAKPLSLEEEQEYWRGSGHGFDHYRCVGVSDVRRMLATIKQQRARVAVLEEALRELVAEFDQDNEQFDEPGYGDVPDTGGMLLARAALAGKEVSG
jgi:hypothetical protein